MGEGEASGDRKEPSSSEKGKETEPDRANRERDPDLNTPSSIGNDSVQKHHNGTDHGNERDNKWRRFFGDIKQAEWIMIVFTAVTAGAACAGVVIADYQWKLGKSQIALGKKQFDWARGQQKAADITSNRALSIAQTAADAAQTQARATEQMVTNGRQQITQSRNLFVTQQQPYVDLNPDKSTNEFGFDQAGGVYVWHYWFKNTGLGPAKHFVIRESLSISDRPAQTHTRNKGDSVTLSAGGKGDSGAWYAPTAQERALPIKDPVLRVRFEYDDQFGNPLHHTICRRLGGNDVYVCDEREK